jgi:SAM-dependent methyltransferase
MSLVERFHGGFVHTRRVRVLSHHLEELFPQNAQVLDVGCGDGLLAHRLMQGRPDVDVQGLDVIIRRQTHIPVEAFDGISIPYGDATFDVVLLVDVLHHAQDPMRLLHEAARTARNAIVIKDHTLNGFLAGPTLRFLDWVGNARHGVALPYNYWPQERWFEAFSAFDLTISVWKRILNLYPWPANWLFERSLHFIARLDFH